MRQRLNPLLRRIRRVPWAALLLISMPLMAQEPGAPPAAPAADVRVAGHWLGILVIKPAVSELEMLFDFTRSDDGWKGELSLPVRGISGFPLDYVKVDGPTVAFAYTYSAGTSTFTGTLAENGDTISGTLIERGQNVPFQLTRQKEIATPAKPQLRVVETVDDLKRVFNEQSAKTRLLLLLSPTCGHCKAAARVVERYVLDAIDSQDLAVIVLWESALKGDTEASAAAVTSLIPDARAVHLWTPNPSLADVFGKAVGVTSSPVFDLYLLYPPATSWGDAAPAPARLMHALDELPSDRSFNGAKLAAEVREILTKKQ